MTGEQMFECASEVYRGSGVANYHDSPDWYTHLMTGIEHKLLLSTPFLSQPAKFPEIAAMTPEEWLTKVRILRGVHT